MVVPSVFEYVHSFARAQMQSPAASECSAAREFQPYCHVAASLAYAH